MISFSLALLAFLSLTITLWQWLVARRFPLHRRVADRHHAPAVTLLKPLRGGDTETRRCLESWFAQDYSGEVQVLFGVPSAHDPVCDTVRQLIASHPGRDAQLIICAESHGANEKVSTLLQLLRQAKHEFIVVSDADIRVPPDFVANVIAPLCEPPVNLVNCFYRLANPSTLAMHWEAIAINADFWSQVLQARSLKAIDFALGAAMATTRTQLDSIGGFAALADYLADDYHLGNLTARRGGRIEISPVVVECRESPKTWGQVWAHQLRWARTIRSCRPVPYFFSILGNATLWPLLMLLTGASGREREWTKQIESAFGPGTIPIAIPAIFALFLVCLLVRILTALANRARLEESGMQWAGAWLIPTKDLLNAAIWALAFLGNRIVWRGHTYRVTTDGKLVGIAEQAPRSKPAA
ncbi:MAG TPA: bacteriohopanetetrol glucosamine biosynthesis glycosyltransferase HpnI [Verrucomicrobiae bacterium]|nr:bacteriohopanetetrol glucosamine biosynthesis glycosyltransferase HpnI [Verrucomicrobiae bacterium]